MPQLVIDHSDKISNYHALEAVVQFISLNFKMKKSQGYLDSRKITLHESGLKLKVKEMPHHNQSESPCSAIFLVTKCEQET